MRKQAKIIRKTCFFAILVIAHASAAYGQTHDLENTQDNPLNQIKNSGLAKNLWQIDYSQSATVKIHKLLPVPGGNLCHAINIHHVVLNFIDSNDYLRVALPGSDELYVQNVHRTESRYGIAQWSGEVVAHDGLIFSLYFDPVHKSYSSNAIVGAQDTWTIRTSNNLNVICKTG